MGIERFCPTLSSLIFWLLLLSWFVMHVWSFYMWSKTQYSKRLLALIEYKPIEGLLLLYEYISTHYKKKLSSTNDHQNGGICKIMRTSETMGPDHKSMQSSPLPSAEQDVTQRMGLSQLIHCTSKPPYSMPTGRFCLSKAELWTFFCNSPVKQVPCILPCYTWTEVYMPRKA